MSRTEKFQRSEFRHNPYIGTFQRTEGSKPNINRHNPYIGYVQRHAPSSESHGVSLGEKPFRRNFISNIQIPQQRRSVNMIALKNLPLSQFTPSSLSSSDETPVCAICLEAFKDGDELRNLNCSHCFHRACVDIWLLGTLSHDIQLNGTCPTCRRHAAPSPEKSKRLSISTAFSRSDDANMSDLSVPSSSITTSDDEPSTVSFDLISPMSPDWSNDEIFHRTEEENCMTIGQYLVGDDTKSSSILENAGEDVASIESLEYSTCQSVVCLITEETIINTSSNLDNILEDEPSIIEGALGVQCLSDECSEALDIGTVDDRDTLSVLSVSQFSDCGFPLSTPMMSPQRSKIR